MPQRCVIGLSVHTGWAACVAVSGTLRAPRIVLRDEIEMLGDPERFVFHRAAELGAAEARAAVSRAQKQATVRARDAIARVVERVREAGLAVAACAIVAKETAMPATLAEIVAAHPRIHTAEGSFYRDVLRAAVEANGIASIVVPPKTIDLAAAAAALARVGRAVGKPWAKDQKVAALAAWKVL